MSYAELAACRNQYLLAAGDHPTEECTPIAEQLSALRHVIKSGKPPYADFGVWGPYGSRLARFRKTDATTVVNNELVHRRSDGPATFECWLSAWDLYAVAMISLDAATIGTMNRFRSGMVQLNKLFPKMWPVMATTDVILRTERLSRIREQIETTLTFGGPLGVITPRGLGTR